MISSIYGSNKAMYKVGERKGKTKAEIQKLENLKTKKKKVIPKKKPNMNSGIKTFNQAQEIKVEVTEYPGYFINMAGLVCYKHGNGYRYCKKADKQSVYVIVDGKQTLVNEVELADTRLRLYELKLGQNYINLNKFQLRNMDLVINNINKLLLEDWLP